MTEARQTVRGLLVGLMSVGLVAVAAGQTTGGRQPSLAMDSLSGRDSFDRYCASCHGVGGRGDGTVAGALQRRPADLTALAERSGGTFPRAAVRGYIEGSGRALPAHGTGDMPVWGVAFKALERSDARAGVRIDNLVAHIESIQTSRAGAAATAPPDRRAIGAQLYRTHCAVCHGEAGRGNGPMALTLRRPPSDLTRYTARNGGTFPSAQLRRVIDGRDVPSHGPGDMPVWGEVFRRATGDTGQAQARIDALVIFLESIQSRAAE